MFLASELGKTLTELRQNMTEEELIYWAAYYENKYENEKKMRHRANSREYKRNVFCKLSG